MELLLGLPSVLVESGGGVGGDHPQLDPSLFADFH